MAEEAILKSIDAHMRRGNELMEQVREEHRLNRTAYAEGIRFMANVAERNVQAFLGLMAELGRFRERIDVFGERIDAFGATLEIQREILLRFLERLDEEHPPRG